jgi:hypothetical protein
VALTCKILAAYGRGATMEACRKKKKEEKKNNYLHDLEKWT